jgi:alpha-galactosidase
MNQSNITVQRLGAEAALTGDPELAVAAIAMFEGEAKYLPRFEGRKPRRLATVSIPKGTVGVEVPLDPALAVVHRFGKLARNK